MKVLENVENIAVIDDSMEKRRISAIKGAFFSEFIDMFDVYLPVIVLSPVLAYFQPDHISAGTQATLASLIFVTTLLGRPVGAMIFGVVADRTGRRMASIYSVIGFGIVTLLIALLPSYQSIGIYSYLLLIGLRFVDGIFLGGGYTGAVPLALEHSKKHQRGFVGGLIVAGFPLAYVVISLLTLGMFLVAPLDGLDSPYAQWGWRIPFVVGSVLAGMLAIYYIRTVKESEIWISAVDSKAKKVPLSDLMKGKSARNLIQVILLMTGFWLTQNIITIFTPSVLLSHVLHLPKFQLTLTLLISFAASSVGYIVIGIVGQKVGRRRLFMICGPLIATVGVAIMYVLSSSQGLPLSTIMILVCVMVVLVTAPWGMILTYINERFATDVRATGFGVGYSLSVIIPSFYAFYMNWMNVVLPVYVTPAVLLGVGGLIGAIGAFLGPETNDVDF